MAALARIIPKSIAQACGKDAWNIVIILSLYFITFVWILPALCQDWVYSKYFMGEKNSNEYVRKALDINDMRLAEADIYFSKQTESSEELLLKQLKLDNSHALNVAVGIITISRTQIESEYESGRLGYLTQVAAKLHALSQDKRYMGRKKVFICNVDARPQQHREAEMLARYIPMVQRFDGQNYSWTNLKKSEIFEKEKQDYVFCLIQALDLAPKYVMLVEDDAIPNDNVFHAAEHLLNMGIINNRLRQDEGVMGKPWLFLKLYYPEKWQGYANELNRYLELASVAILGGSIFVVTFSLLPVWIRKLRYSSTTRRILTYFILGAMYSVLLVYLLGRPYVLALRNISPYFSRLVPAPDCCTQAVIYPAYMARKLAHNLSSVHCTIDFSVDLAIDRYADDRNLMRYLVEPNLVKHIGLVSTVRGYAKRAA